MKTAYNQLPLDEVSQDNSAFTNPLGLARTRMAFGLLGASASFQTLMDRTFRTELYQIVLCKLDNLFVHSNTVAEHLRRLDVVFQKPGDAVLKLEFEKCFFLKQKVV